VTTKEYNKLQEYAAAARSLRETVRAVEGLTSAIARRVKDYPKIQVGVSVPAELRRDRRYDSGCYVRVPREIVRDHILPGLRKALRGYKDDLAALPPVITDTK